MELCSYKEKNQTHNLLIYKLFSNYFFLKIRDFIFFIIIIDAILILNAS